ncbi:MAG: hypothetical protein RBR35_15605 [Salinivirgaceae bacterium]|nr:hypothetical protein [Salinivirgaceae bacterium]
MMERGSGGYPFLYEIGIVGVLCVVVFKILAGVPFTNLKDRWDFWILNLFYIPIFLNFFLFSGDSSEFFGGGQLRLQLEIWLLGLCLIAYPPSKQTVVRAIYLVIIMAVVNNLQAILAFFGLVSPVYKIAYRENLLFRHSGFMQMPGHLGVLSAVAVAWSLWFQKNRFIAIAVATVCVFGIYLADSRTAIVASCTVIVLKFLTNLHLKYKTKHIIFCIFVIIFTPFIFFAPESTWSNSRPMSILAAIQIWSDNVLGVPWGSFGKYNPYPLLAVSPHNWPAISLLHGGILSFLPVVFAHIFIIKSLKLYHTNNHLSYKFLFIIIAITISSWFEQVLQNSNAAFMFILLITFLSAEQYALKYEKREIFP